MALWLVAPARTISSIIGRTLAANRLALAFKAALPSLTASAIPGLPKRCPRFLAACSAALVRSEIISRSSQSFAFNPASRHRFRASAAVGRPIGETTAKNRREIALLGLEQESIDRDSGERVHQQVQIGIGWNQAERLGPLQDSTESEPTRKQDVLFVSEHQRRMVRQRADQPGGELAKLPLREPRDTRPISDIGCALRQWF